MRIKTSTHPCVSDCVSPNHRPSQTTYHIRCTDVFPFSCSVSHVCPRNFASKRESYKPYSAERSDLHASSDVGSNLCQSKISYCNIYRRLARLCGSSCDCVDYDSVKNAHRKWNRNRVSRLYERERRILIDRFYE